MREDMERILLTEAELKERVANWAGRSRRISPGRNRYSSAC